MKLYTTVILNTHINPYDPDRMECLTFKSLDSAVEYLVDWLYDEGFIDNSEVPEVEKSLREKRIYRATANGKDFLLVENELCNW